MMLQFKRGRAVENLLCSDMQTKKVKSTFRTSKLIPVIVGKEE